MTEEKRKQIVKPHNVITARMNLSSREQDFLSLIILECKKYADREKFAENGIEFDPTNKEHLERIPTIFTFPKSSLSKALGVSPHTLNKRNKDTGEYYLHEACKGAKKKGFDYLDKDTGHFLTGVFIAEASYNGKELMLETTRSMAGRFLDYGLQHDNFGLVDMRLFFSLKGEYDKRILDLISRFKNERDFSMSIGEFCRCVGVEFSGFRDFNQFRQNTLDRPLKQIIKRSCGIWTPNKSFNGGKGYTITKKGKKYSEKDQLTFRMIYTDPESQQVQAETFKADLEALMKSDNDEISLRAMMVKSTLNFIELGMATPEQIRHTMSSISELGLEMDEETTNLVNEQLNQQSN